MVSLNREFLSDRISFCCLSLPPDPFASAVFVEISDRFLEGGTGRFVAISAVLSVCKALPIRLYIKLFAFSSPLTLLLFYKPGNKPVDH